jgi:two-component sensor histidine kinase
MPATGPLDEVEDGKLLAQAIVDTIREPLLVLDKDLRVIAASRSFYLKFRADRQLTQGQFLSALGEGQWNIPPLRALLERIAPDQSVLDDYEVELDFPKLGRRILLLNARKVFYEGTSSANILIAIEDVTERRAVESDREDLSRRKDLLLEEFQHRVANSLAIISSILLLKARTVGSEEIRAHIEDARNRVMSVATVQEHLHSTKAIDSVELAPYLKSLCGGLAGSMINDEYCSIETHVSAGSVTSSAAVSIGLIVTELVINALKHAFPEAKPGCTVIVSYDVNGTDWKLSVADNGCGKSLDAWPPAKVGLGTSIVSALAGQLDARVDTVSGPTGTTVSIAHSRFKTLPKVAALSATDA